MSIWSKVVVLLLSILQDSPMKGAWAIIAYNFNFGAARNTKFKQRISPQVKHKNYYKMEERMKYCGKIDSGMKKSN